jgi:hypothetical protein
MDRENDIFKETYSEKKGAGVYVKKFDSYLRSLQTFIDQNFSGKIPPELFNFMDTKISLDNPENFDWTETVRQIKIAENFIERKGVGTERPEEIKKFFEEGSA